MSGAVYVDAMMASVHLMMAYGAHVTPEQIRQWGKRNQVSRLPRGRYRYDLAEVEAYARDRDLIGAQHCHAG